MIALGEAGAGGRHRAGSSRSRPIPYPRTAARGDGDGSGSRRHAGSGADGRRADRRVAPRPLRPPRAGRRGAPSAGGDLGDAALTGAGLPPLYSLPGALLARRHRALAAGGGHLACARPACSALGGAGSCSHGLDSGLPDLRKVLR